VKSFLESEGYNVGSRRELFIGSRKTLAEETEYTYVWVPENYDTKTFTSRESTFLSRFDEAARSSPVASRFMVIPTLEGLSRQFREGVLQWYRVNIRTPVQFFDTDFKWDMSREAPSAAKELRDKGQQESKRRVEQPYTVVNTKKSVGDWFRKLDWPYFLLCFQDSPLFGEELEVCNPPSGCKTRSYLRCIHYSVDTSIHLLPKDQNSGAHS